MYQTRKNNMVVVIVLLLIFLFRKKIMSLFKKNNNNDNNDFSIWGNKTSLDDYYQFVLDKEGGQSDIDTNSSFAPGTQVNVNKGVNYDSYVQYCLNNGILPNNDDFLEMPYELWKNIANQNYYDVWDMDRLTSNALRHLVHSWAWGSGNYGAEVRFANWIRDNYTPEQLAERGINNYNNISKSEIITILNEYESEYLFNLLIDRRAEDFATMSNFNLYGNGWLSRLDEFKELHFVNE